MTETNTVDGLVLGCLGEHFHAPDASPINAVSVLWMLERAHPDMTVAQVVTSFRALAGAGEVRLLHHGGQAIAVVEGLAS